MGFRTRNLSVPVADDLVPVVVGCDVGKKVDPSAIVVVEERFDRDVRLESYDVRYAQRVPMGTNFTLVANALVGIVRQQREHDAAKWGKWAEYMEDAHRVAEQQASRCG